MVALEVNSEVQIETHNVIIAHNVTYIKTKNQKNLVFLSINGSGSSCFVGFCASVLLFFWNNNNQKIQNQEEEDFVGQGTQGMNN